MSLKHLALFRQSRVIGINQVFLSFSKQKKKTRVLIEKTGFETMLIVYRLGLSTDMLG